MNRKKLIVISGLSGTGKTTLGRYLSEELNFPFINKDSLKEIMFDKIGWKDREWSQKLGAASYGAMYYLAEELIKCGCSVIVESNFRAEIDGEKLRNLGGRYGCQIIEVLCWAEGGALFERFKKRAESGERHPGHVDHLCYEEQEKRLLVGKAQSLRVGRVIELNTSDWEKVDYKGVLRKVRQELGIIGNVSRTKDKKN
ncbi:MAG: AAA family ATPase [Patescibacteria group bacterium]|jgi:predicted kinase